MEQQFVMLCNCVRPSTGTEMTIPVPLELTPETIVDYIGNEFDWQFIPMEVQVVPREEVKNYMDEM